MTGQDKLELELLIVAPKSTLRELQQLRRGLFAEIEQGLAGDGIKLTQASDSRALDPAIVGAIGIAVLSVVLDKLSDLLIDWMKRHPDCRVTIEVPVAGGKSRKVELSGDVSSDVVTSVLDVLRKGAE